MSFMSIFGKVGTAGKAQANKAADAALDADPMAVLRLQNDEDAEHIQKTQPDMERFRGQVRGLERQVHDEDDELKEMNATIDATLQEEASLRASGKTPEADQAAADANALQTQYDERNATHQKTVLAYGQLNGTYQSTTKSITDAQDRINQRTKQAQSLGRQLEQSQIVKTAVTTAADIRKTDLGSVGATNSRAINKVQEMIDANFSAGEVQDLYNGNGHPDPAAELKQRVQDRLAASKNTDALAARRAKLGLATQIANPSGASATPPGTMTGTFTANVATPSI